MVGFPKSGHILCMITQMAEQLVTTGNVDERELLKLDLKQARIQIGESLLNSSGTCKYEFVHVYS